jgi:copper resistance protein C
MKHLQFFLISALLAASAPLLAHTHLEAATPADGAVLKTAPASVELSFGEDVQLLKLDVAGASGEAVEIDFKPSAISSKAFVVPLPSLKPSVYTVDWTVLGADGHRLEGHFGFTVDPAAAESAGHAEHHDH